ncbi:deoxyribodipyrimidine photo-lyase [Chlorobium ferrooxidans]|uniref:Deoxyribodipyrimidine photo-lyase n=1 Tax=Chlorobium ferrooxidans DSM 13031 TaxID=377431 RepID=Q0YV00_9CHLB|nr:deoxyribodipyrimidine photo-lyase [Chlorobium ferrooxidans]EAT59892.1 deoxyribodipyrimidine photolyase [Chlorobium ferrooxidans DSM 13031]
MIDPRRITLLNNCRDASGPVIYWMSRDQRVRHNWALLFARKKAEQLQQPLKVVFTLAPSFLNAPLRHYDFMLKGLHEVERALRRLNIPFYLVQGEPEIELPRFAREMKAGAVVTDFSPLKISREWKRRVGAHLPLPLYEVDAHNIVPCRIASAKQEYAARTFRPKIKSLLGELLTGFPQLEPLEATTESHPVDWSSISCSLKADHRVAPVEWLKPGEEAAANCLDTFLEKRLSSYAELRNDPNSGVLSNLSPYLHFGQISAQYIALRVSESRMPDESRSAFLEELIVRRELSDNYCFYNDRYDSFDGSPTWAKESLMNHRNDHREYLYTADEFATAKTHDRLWNAAQLELVTTGKIHGYMRMYWAKKILEWSESAEQAFETAMALNDRYALDGRDPNGYAGVAWSIGGVHDRPWFERPVYGKIRYMNASGCARKFDVARYIARFEEKKSM